MAQKKPGEILIRQQPGGSVLGNHPTTTQNVTSVTEFQCLSRSLFDQQHGNTICR